MIYNTKEMGVTDNPMAVGFLGIKFFLVWMEIDWAGA
jgi:hypothetical protein